VAAYAYANNTMFETNKGLINAILTNDKITEEEKSELIAKMIEEFKSEYPELKYHATKQDISETELRLTKEIENTKKEIKELDVKIAELDAKLTKEIENTRKEIKELDIKLTKEIENTRKEIKELDVKLTGEIKEVKISMLKWNLVFWTSQMSALFGIGFFILKALKL